MMDTIHISSPENFLLPPIWDNDDAMFLLMQPIRRPKHIDPEAYNKKIKFWTDLIVDYAKRQRVSVVSIQSLQTVFSRYFLEEGIHMSPQCLPEVFTSLMESGKLECIEDSSSLVHTILKTSFNYLIKAPLDWTFRIAFGTSGKPSAGSGTSTVTLDPEQHYAFTDLSEDLASQFIAYFVKKYESQRLTFRLPVYELCDFEKGLIEFFPHDATREYIKKLCTDVFCCVRFESVCDSEGTWKSQVVRVTNDVDCPVPSKTADYKTELSILGGLAHIRTVIRQLEAEEQKLTTEIEERRNRIKALMKQNRCVLPLK
ncbi:unnamed protein product [Echinostoma caproni]|uniref:Charged multivesicular body protein 7 n=1 Tax=Echinostoma caproni TaxID=27848 RepID=A0A183B6K5_9TREM|nr:unnamed protein product [Echinostoma caproni]